MEVTGISRKVLDTSRRWRAGGARIGFVPTMGNLHQGHLSLVELAAQHCDRVVVSIYVNPMQFGPNEDFEAYPRTLERDIEMLTPMGVDLVFTPESQVMYAHGEAQSAWIEVPGLSSILEGEYRPGFFRGVATVVNKLFNIVQPDIAVFGEKDYQQLLVIRHMVRDLDIPVEIIAGATRREADGLAMSSRNGYLDAAQRSASASLFGGLLRFRDDLCRAYEAADALRRPDAPELAALSSRLQAEAIARLEAAGFSIDYFSLRQAADLSAIDDTTPQPDCELIVLVAARIGGTRLIDNLRFTLPLY